MTEVLLNTCSTVYPTRICVIRPSGEGSAQLSNLLLWYPPMRNSIFTGRTVARFSKESDRRCAHQAVPAVLRCLVGKRIMVAVIFIRSRWCCFYLISPAYPWALCLLIGLAVHDRGA